MEWLILQPWHWLVLGVLLLVAEVMGAGGFLIGLALAAFVQSAIAVYSSNLSWDFQLLVFAIDSVIFTWIYWKFFRKFNEQTDTPNLNNREAQYIGRQFQLKDPMVNGEGKIQIGDSLWRIRSEQPLEVGETIRVIGNDGMVLLVEAA